MEPRGGATYTLKVSKGAESDIDELCEGDEELYESLWRAIEELGDDQYLLERLLEDRYGKRNFDDRHNHKIGVQQIRVFAGERPQRDLWAFKFWEFELKGVPLRFVYMYLPRKRWFILLAIVERKWNYDPAHHISERIRCAYDKFRRDYDF